jgi:hypothetical protein
LVAVHPSPTFSFARFEAVASPNEFLIKKAQVKKVP